MLRFGRGFSVHIANSRTSSQECHHCFGGQARGHQDGCGGNNKKKAKLPNRRSIVVNIDPDFTCGLSSSNNLLFVCQEGKAIEDNSSDTDSVEETAEDITVPEPNVPGEIQDIENEDKVEQIEEDSGKEDGTVNDEVAEEVDKVKDKDA